MPKDATKKKSKASKTSPIDKPTSAPSSTTETALSTSAVAAGASEGGKKSKKDKKDKKGKKGDDKAAVVETAGVVGEPMVVDAELDDLFKTTAALNIPPPAPLPSTSSLSSTKASRAAAVRDLPPHLQRSLPTAPPKKGSNSALANSVAAASEAAAVLDANADLSELESDADLSDFEVSDEESDDNGGLEEAYEKKQQAGGAQKEVKETVISQETGLPVHESQAGEVLASGKGVVASSSGAGAVESVSKAGKKTKKYTPEGETKEERDGRTIFIGNLPMEIAKSKPMLHALHAHILTSLPSLAKIESTRFRSIAFSKPSADLPATTDEAAAARSKSRAKERVKNWREQQEIDAEGRGGEAEADRGKVFLGEGEKRRVAFIKKDFHPEAGGLNAYIVFAHPAPDRSTKVAPLMDPSLAAQTAVKHCNGTTFEARTIRVDLVRPPASSVTTARATSALWVAGTDPKKSVFVGNLAFGAKEEEVRVFFEDLVKGERGEVPEEGEKEGMEKGRWVQNVRIVRDRETGLGKGFAYVALRDRESVDEILALPEEKLKYNKRPLRVQRCKSLPSKPKPTPAAGPTSHTHPTLPRQSTNTPSDPSSSSAPTPIAIPSYPKKLTLPKGNPNLGAAIADLPKDERKLAKAADADRLARRMAKKKAKGVMERSLAARGKTSEGAKVGTRERVRLEPTGAMNGGKGKPGVGLKAKKGRVRSAAAAKKVNNKKA